MTRCWKPGLCFCALSSDPYEATTMGNSCIQFIDKTYGDFIGLDMWNAQSPLSEDCLYLNIWVPHQLDAAANATSNTTSMKSKKAVMVGYSIRIAAICIYTVHFT